MSVTISCRVPKTSIRHSKSSQQSTPLFTKRKQRQSQQQRKEFEASSGFSILPAVGSRRSWLGYSWWKQRGGVFPRLKNRWDKGVGRKKSRIAPRFPFTAARGLFRWRNGEGTARGWLKNNTITSSCRALKATFFVAGFLVRWQDIEGAATDSIFFPAPAQNSFFLSVCVCVGPARKIFILFFHF